MAGLPAQEKILNNPLTPAAKTESDSYKIALVVAEKLDVNRAAQIISGTGPAYRIPASTTAERDHGTQLWCFPNGHPRLRIAANKLTIATLTSRLDEYTEVIHRFYESDKNSLTSYTVLKGDTLESISKKLVGNNTIWIEIFLLNKALVPNWDKIKTGQQLTVPASNILPVNCHSS